MDDMRRIGRIYVPVGVNTVGGSNPIIDDPYNAFDWDGDTSHGASRNSIRDWIEAQGYLGNVVYVDATYGNDFTAVKGNILKPYKTHFAAMVGMNSGIRGLCVTFPGVYMIPSAFGYPMKDQIDHFFMNATIYVATSSFAYGSLMIYPDYVQCRMWGKGTFVNQSSNTDWAQITPYVECDLDIEGITFIGNKQLIGQLGAITGPVKKVRFKNCQLITNNNFIPSSVNAGNLNAFGDTLCTFEDCYLKGLLMVSTFNTTSEEYGLKFSRCRFQAVNINSNTYTSSLMILDYGADTTTYKVLLDHCLFKGSNENLFTGTGFGGDGTNKYLVIDNCRFENGVEGWIKNDSANMNFKMIGNWAKNTESGSATVTNMLAGTGMTIDSNLEVVL